MNHIKKSDMRLAIDTIAESLFKECSAKRINSFWQKFSGEKISYIGFNFENNEITSVKIYFVVFSNNISPEDFPIKELYSEFIENLINQSPLVKEKFANGGGITFSIKAIKGQDHIEYGYYLRCKRLTRQEEPLIDRSFKPFDAQVLSDSIGVYHTIFDGLTQIHLYGYTNPSELFPSIQQDKINFEKIRGVELAKINQPEKLKYIYLGGEDVFKRELLNQIPEEIISFRNKFSLNFVCPAFNLTHKLCSVYLTDFLNKSMLPDIQLLTKF